VKKGNGKNSAVAVVVMLFNGFVVQLQQGTVHYRTVRCDDRGN
jgi:hypothetical protein